MRRVVILDGHGLGSVNLWDSVLESEPTLPMFGKHDPMRATMCPGDGSDRTTNHSLEFCTEGHIQSAKRPNSEHARGGSLIFC